MRLDQYYRDRGFSPTFADFRDEAQLGQYQAMREAMFRDRLALPPRLFRGVSLLEFGPDTGENALIFARWGATITLAEPNPAAHDVIRAYFNQFDCRASLVEVIESDVLGFALGTRYDVVVAEGFIHTVKPISAWLETFRGLLHDDGLFIVSYYERHGGLVELALRALYASYRRAVEGDPLAAAEALYRVKWDAIPHSRSFASWVYDVLDNPMQSLAAYIDAASLVAEARVAGFDLYSSYPRYNDVLEVEWHKRIVTPAERAQRAERHIRRSVLSFLAGRTLYLIDDADAAAIGAEADGLLTALDALYWSDAPGMAARAADGFERLVAMIGRAELIDNGRPERVATMEAFGAFGRAFRLVSDGRIADLPKLTSTDAALIATWGAPNHHAVGRALAQSSVTKVPGRSADT
jgi:hypothetical protein